MAERVRSSRDADTVISVLSVPPFRVFLTIASGYYARTRVYIRVLDLDQLEAVAVDATVEVTTPDGRTLTSQPGTAIKGLASPGSA